MKLFISFVNSKDFPFTEVIFISGSEVSKKLKLKDLKPENPDRTINKARVPTITPMVAISVIILMVLLLLFENRYRLAM